MAEDELVEVLLLFAGEKEFLGVGTWDMAFGEAFCWPASVLGPWEWRPFCRGR